MTSDDFRGTHAVLRGNRAYAPPDAPPIVHRAIAAGNSIQGVPYEYGGGHGKRSRGLDCSGTVSYVLRSCGLMRGAMPSKGFKKFGDGGAGKWITIYARDGHAFMTVAGLRLDTTRHGNGEAGPTWNPQPRRVTGFKTRHPAGL